MPFGTGADCTRAIDAAHAALSGWSRATPYERGAVLKRAAGLMRADVDALARTTVLESGKPLVQARGEWLVSADLFEWFAEEGKRAYGRIIPSRVADQAPAGAEAADRRGRHHHRLELSRLQRRARRRRGARAPAARS